MSRFKEFIKGFKEGQKKCGGKITIIINSVLLSVVYFIGVGVTSLAAKMFGKHFLDLNTDENKETYWEELNLTKKPLEEYYRQF